MPSPCWASSAASAPAWSRETSRYEHSRKEKKPYKGTGVLFVSGCWSNADRSSKGSGKVGGKDVFLEAEIYVG